MSILDLFCYFRQLLSVFVLQDIQERSELLMVAEAAATKAKVVLLFNYFGDTWFGLYSRDQWSVYKDSERTNNWR